jgi:predicted glycosyltransferase
MFPNRLYYLLKPLLPRALRLSVRGVLAQRKRRRVAGIWPILPGSERRPSQWPGWPQGSKFAFVITHDVEGKHGLDNCLKLMELEKELGFRSSFNFVPEGEYEVPASIRNALAANGFETGVHDLKHDGKLYNTRAGFARKAERINNYLKEWGAVGFRSGFMLHNLDWLHDLNVEYEASTFDTDPFEPQPDGMGTIFPLWVARSLNTSEAAASEVESRREGYVELPYTLPQDSTLFLLLREGDSSMWRNKLDWIAEHGGMALVNVHPDYLQFENQRESRSTFSVNIYREFLMYVKSRYQGAYWQPLPREMASFARTALKPNASAPTAVRKPREARPKIWFDLDNTPHVPFFEPIIKALKSEGYPVLVTARDAFQVCALAEKSGVSFVKVGRHYGKNRFLKAAGLFWRAMQLSLVARGERPDLAVSHGARSQIISSNLLGIPTLMLDDYEHSEYPPMMRPTRLLVPQVIPGDRLCLPPERVSRYPGIKEDVYAWSLKPDPSILDKIGFKTGEILVTVRPPATEAHYHNTESELLFVEFMNRAVSNPNVRIVLLPRNQRQASWIASRNPIWFKEKRTIIPAEALDGMNLIWHSELVVSGGGTMNREAAALGVPVYSIFRGKIGAVDEHLSAVGRLVMIKSTKDVHEKIRLERVARGLGSEAGSKASFNCVLETILQNAHDAASSSGGTKSRYSL